MGTLQRNRLSVCVRDKVKKLVFANYPKVNAEALTNIDTSDYLEKVTKANFSRWKGRKIKPRLQLIRANTISICVGLLQRIILSLEAGLIHR